MLKPEEKWRFSYCQLFGVLLGGICEFGTSLCSILAFGKAASNGINAGVAGVLIPLSGVIVSIASYFFFGERMQIVQIVGLVVLLAGATLIVMYPAEDDETGDKASLSEIMIVLLLSLLIAVFLSFEILISKTLAHRGVEGKYLGFGFLLSEGLLGTICLIIATIAGEGIFKASGEVFWMMMLGGLTGVISISLLQYSVSIGIAGIASSVFNTNVVFFTGLCFLFLDQALTV